MHQLTNIQVVFTFGYCEWCCYELYEHFYVGFSSFPVSVVYRTVWGKQGSSTVTAIVQVERGCWRAGLGQQGQKEGTVFEKHAELEPAGFGDSVRETGT